MKVTQMKYYRTIVQRVDINADKKNSQSLPHMQFRN